MGPRGPTDIPCLVSKSRLRHFGRSASLLPYHCPASVNMEQVCHLCETGYLPAVFQRE